MAYRVTWYMLTLFFHMYSVDDLVKEELTIDPVKKGIQPMIQIDQRNDVGLWSYL